MGPFVSLIIPCRNEINFIDNLIDNLIDQDYPSERIEIIIVDGDSDDGTLNRIQEKCQIYPQIKLLKNEDRIVPPALNKAIKHSKGEYIIRIDAHCEYPTNYVSRLIEIHQQNDVENVGGIWITTAGDQTNVAQAIAIATAHGFGVGNAYYRIGIDKLTEVDTVPYGCFKRDLFDRIGLFDLDLVRNQDDEFNARIIKNGGKILLIPDVEIKYFARPTLGKMSKMFYQYGLYKPLVNRKIGKPATIRQLIPFLFVTYLVFGAFVFILPPLLQIAYLFGIFVYLIINSLISSRLAIQNKKFAFLILLPLTFLLIHLSYGWGYIKGIFRFLILNTKTKPTKIDTNR